MQDIATTPLSAKGAERQMSGFVMGDFCHLYMWSDALDTCQGAWNEALKTRMRYCIYKSIVCSKYQANIKCYSGSLRVEAMWVA